ncbi:OmpA family protein [Pseudomonas sp. JQ170]|uniref:OmpA family protein n=1 Tax=unclassified Pseudomonas TaxID=196821 RepID=UPI002651FCFD|nr:MULTISPECIES: OmpA family protein [unclassified Pseudomonas]MDN7142884.1 OmpA family protein [Pseudomonas sp. JQ170]WRO74651.1 OmpA family protein [Pseudomonas sp. 170C]
MKLKNTLGLAIGSLVAATSLGALAQGQGAVEIEGNVTKQYYDSERNFQNDGTNPGVRLGYFLTDDLSLDLGYNETHNVRGDVFNKDIKGSKAKLDATYHLGTVGDAVRPYVSAGFAHESLGQSFNNGRDHSTFANVGAGAKWYITDMFFARAGVEAMYNIDNGNTEWGPSLGLGLNFGGSGGKVAPAPAPVAEVCSDSDNDGVCDNVDKCPDTPANVTVDADGCPAVAEVVRVELDVKFDFDKSVVKQNSYGDIKNLADFMKQYPQTTTTVEGHTDSVGPDAYNQKLSERRANAVKQVLTNEYGVESTRVESVGYGETRPVADNATDAGRAVNRRVEAQVEAQAK